MTTTFKIAYRALTVFGTPLLAVLLIGEHVLAEVPKPAIKSLNLCEDSEKNYFTCQTSKSKIVSLCGTPELTKEKGYLQYRFGREKSIELQYPKETKGSQKLFYFSHYSRAQVDRLAVSFTNENNKYMIYENYEEDIEPARKNWGVSIVTAKEKEATITCKKPEVDHLQDLESALNCDPDDAESKCN